METISTSTPKARKQHRCNFCEGVIEKGEAHDQQTNKHDGVVYQWRAHFRCSKIANTLNMYEYCDEGLTGETFYERICLSFDHIERERFGEELPEGYERPSFLGQLDVVCNHYLK